MDSFLERYSEKLKEYKKAHDELGCAVRHLEEALTLFKRVACQSVDPTEDSFRAFDYVDVCEHLEEAKVTADVYQKVIRETVGLYALAVEGASTKEGE